MKMNELPDGIAVPAGGTVTLAPGGLHLMFMGLKAPLVENETVPVTLTFAKAGTIEIELARRQRQRQGTRASGGSQLMAAVSLKQVRIVLWTLVVVVADRRDGAVRLRAADATR